MPFTVELLANQVPAGTIVSDRRLFVTADERTVVEDGDVRARFLLCAAGGTIPADRVRDLGLAVADGKVIQQPDVKERERPEDKQLEKPADKSRAPEDRKSGTRTRG